MFGRLYPALQVDVPVGELPGITCIGALLNAAARFVAGQIYPGDAANRVGGQAELLRSEKFACHDFAGEGADQHDLKAERQVFAGDVEQTRIFAVAQVLQIGWAVAVGRIAGQQTHDVRAERTVGGVFVQKEEVSAATRGELGVSLFGERGLTGASVTSEKNESGWVHGRYVFKLTV